MPTIVDERVADDDLTLLHYGELEPARAAELRAALEADPKLAARYRTLSRSLDAAGRAPLPEPAADLGERMWARVEPRLGVQDGARATRAPWLAFAAAAGIATVAVVVWLGRVPGAVPTDVVATTEADVAFTPQARERVLLTRVAHHLDGSQRLLASVSNSEPTRADLADARAWAQRALSANRIYRSAAAGAGEKRMVALLDAMEPLLIEIANAPETMTPGELAFLQQRIEDADLLFRMRSAQNRIETRANQASPRDVQPAQRSDI